jgi:hypothetical protein
MVSFFFSKTLKEPGISHENIDLAKAQTIVSKKMTSF